MSVEHLEVGAEHLAVRLRPRAGDDRELSASDRFVEELADNEPMGIPRSITTYASR